MRPTKAQIHYTMSRVRSSGSEIETCLGRALWKAGIRYRKQYNAVGRPDFVLVRAKIAIFCDSEFWDGYRWSKKSRAAFKRNRKYWIAKIERNRSRDRAVNRRLKKEGWLTLRFWERQIQESLADCVQAVIAAKSLRAVQ